MPRLVKRWERAASAGSVESAADIRPYPLSPRDGGDDGASTHAASPASAPTSCVVCVCGNTSRWRYIEARNTGASSTGTLGQITSHQNRREPIRAEATNDDGRAISETDR